MAYFDVSIYDCNKFSSDSDGNDLVWCPDGPQTICECFRTGLWWQHGVSSGVRCNTVAGNGIRLFGNRKRCCHVRLHSPELLRKRRDRPSSQAKDRDQRHRTCDWSIRINDQPGGFSQCLERGPRNCSRGWQGPQRTAFLRKSIFLSDQKPPTIARKPGTGKATSSFAPVLSPFSCCMNAI